MRIRTATVALLFIVGAVSFATADVVQVRFLDETGAPIEGRGATMVTLGSGIPMSKLTPTTSTQSVYDVEVNLGEKVAFLVENPISILSTYEINIPSDVTGILDIEVGATRPSGPGQVNDLCADAIALAVPSITGGSTVGATIDAGTATCGAATVTAPGVWYSFIGTGLTVTASTCNAANYDTKISIFCLGCDVQQCAGGFDDYPGCAGFTTQVTVPTQAGFEYLVMVHGFAAETGNFNLSLSEGAAADFAAVDCAPQGACCNCSSTAFNCNQGSEVFCATLGDQYLGDGTECISPANMPQTFPSGPINLPISNTLAITASTITIPTSFVVADVKVELDIAHTWVADIEIIITHNATARQLWGNRCGSTDNIRATFDDEGTETLCVNINAGPSNAVFISSAIGGNGPLALFDGSDAFGAWDLTIDDTFGGDDGTLEQWKLILDAGVPNCALQNDATCYLCPLAGDDDDDDDDDDFQNQIRSNDQGPRNGGVDVRRVD